MPETPMIKRISTIYPLDGRKLLVWFEGGEARVFDCDANLSRHELAAMPTRKAFEQAQLTADGYAVSWERGLDITSKDLFEEGSPVDVPEGERNRIVSEVATARKQLGFSQQQMENITGVRQPVIARMETGANAPRLDTLLKLLAPLGKTLRVVDMEAPLGDSA